mmetsp:Transcript_16656/g.45079  ORF Transcript_16656/g.45079 Transcript_16656/m.45079 type:complete len:222 (-) Transcript_16656:2202-2867(-)
MSHPLVQFDSLQSSDRQHHSHVPLWGRTVACLLLAQSQVGGSSTALVCWLGGSTPRSSRGVRTGSPSVHCRSSGSTSTSDSVASSSVCHSAGGRFSRWRSLDDPGEPPDQREDCVGALPHDAWSQPDDRSSAMAGTRGTLGVTRFAPEAPLRDGKETSLVIGESPWHSGVQAGSGVNLTCSERSSLFGVTAASPVTGRWCGLSQPNCGGRSPPDLTNGSDS